MLYEVITLAQHVLGVDVLRRLLEHLPEQQDGLVGLLEREMRLHDAGQGRERGRADVRTGCIAEEHEAPFVLQAPGTKRLAALVKQFYDTSGTTCTVVVDPVV